MVEIIKTNDGLELVNKADYDKLVDRLEMINALMEVAKEANEHAKTGFSALQADYDKLAAECAPYKKFFEHAWSLAIEACDFDGASIQDLSIELGLVKSEIYDSDKHSDLVNDESLFENGDDVYFPVKTPTTDAAIAEFKAQGREEGIIFATNRILAAWESGFIDDTPAQALDISGAVLCALEFLPNATDDEFKRDYADEVRAAIAAKLRAGVNG